MLELSIQRFVDLGKPSRRIWIGAIAAFGIWRCLNFAYKCMRRQKLLKLIDKNTVERRKNEQKLKSHLQEILSQNQDLEEKWKQIAQMRTPKLQEQLKSRQLTAVEVLHAFQWSALRANSLTNCIIEYFDEAEAEAIQLDEKYGQSDDKPPLFGIPVSIKDTLLVKGHKPNSGLASMLLGPVPKEDSILVATLRNMGAVPFCMTNVPQTKLSMGTFNPVYGTTTNPFNKDRNAGGSSGGEGALIGCNGSPLGMGSDIGGSIRIPSHFCGIAGLKPTSKRMSLMGHVPIFLGVQGITSAWGPMAPDVDTCINFLKYLWAENSPYYKDPYVAPIPFDEKLLDSSEPLTIGFYIDANIIQSAPSCKRAVMIAKSILEAKGHKLVPFNYDLSGTVSTFLQTIINFDGGRQTSELVNNDIKEPLIAAYPHFSLRNWSYRIGKHVAFLVKPFRPRQYTYLKYGIVRNLVHLRKIYTELMIFKAKFTKAWLAAGLDGMICVTTPSPAVPHEYIARMSGLIGTTGVYNLLDYPAGSVNVTYVSENDEETTRTEYHPHDEEEVLLKKCNSHGSVGLPVGVQCVTLPFRDEVCLRIMKEIEDGVNENA